MKHNCFIMAVALAALTSCGNGENNVSEEAVPSADEETVIAGEMQIPGESALQELDENDAGVDEVSDMEDISDDEIEEAAKQAAKEKAGKAYDKLKEKSKEAYDEANAKAKDAYGKAKKEASKKLKSILDKDDDDDE